MADRSCQKFGVGWRKAYEDEVDFGNLPDKLVLTEENMSKLFLRLQRARSSRKSCYINNFLRIRTLFP
jgi:hypothetical protein